VKDARLTATGAAKGTSFYGSLRARGCDRSLGRAWPYCSEKRESAIPRPRLRRCCCRRAAAMAPPLSSDLSREALSSIHGAAGLTHLTATQRVNYIHQLCSALCALCAPLLSSLLLTLFTTRPALGATRLNIHIMTSEQRVVHSATVFGDRNIPVLLPYHLVRIACRRLKGSHVHACCPEQLEEIL
jgi:hypothetical protein